MLSERYIWEAETSSGEIIKEGGDLTTAARFSLIPKTPLLPRHDFVGIKLDRRFGRGFISALGGKGLREYVQCIVANDFRVYIRYSNGSILVTPKDYELYL